MSDLFCFVNQILKKWISWISLSSVQVYVRFETEPSFYVQILFQKENCNLTKRLKNIHCEEKHSIRISHFYKYSCTVHLVNSSLTAQHSTWQEQNFKKCLQFKYYISLSCAHFCWQSISWSWLLLLLSTKEDKKFSNCSSVRPRILKSNAIRRVVLIGRARVRCRLHVRMKLCTCSRHAHYCIDPIQCLEYGSCNLIIRSRVTSVYFSVSPSEINAQHKCLSDDAPPFT